MEVVLKAKLYFFVVGVVLDVDCYPLSALVSLKNLVQNI